VAGRFADQGFIVNFVASLVVSLVDKAYDKVRLRPKVPSHYGGLGSKVRRIAPEFPSGFFDAKLVNASQLHIMVGLKRPVNSCLPYSMEESLC